jgi:hypothetical protein
MTQLYGMSTLSEKSFSEVVRDINQADNSDSASAIITMYTLAGKSGANAGVRKKWA